MRTIKQAKWDAVFLTLAQTISSFSKDPSTKVGAVICNKDFVVLSQGWNGMVRAAKSIAEDVEDKETKYQYVVHAETNAIYNAARIGVSLVNSTIYVYGMLTCLQCAKAIIQSGIKICVIKMNFGKIRTKWEKEFSQTQKLFKEVGVKVYVEYE